MHRSASKRIHPPIRRSVLVALVPSLALGLTASAQHTLPTGPPALLWVDDTGSNANPGTVGLPFQTIAHAISQANTGPGFTVIMVKPGVYDENLGEQFPLVMKKNVSLQGAGALDTVIRSVNDAPVLIEFRATTANAFERVFIDGFTIQHEFVEPGAPQTGILIHNTAQARFPANPTISNCFITDHGSIGIDIVSAPGGDPAHDLDGAFTGFIPHRPRILYCTFRFNQIGVRNTTSQPVSGFLWGANQPGLLNCLFVDQFLFGFGPTDDLQGIDTDDLEVGGVGSNAFERQNTMAGAPLLWIPFPSPLSAVNVGQVRSAIQALGQELFVDTTVFHFAFNDDLRLNPGLKDVSPTLIDAGLDPGNQWSWDNGTSAIRVDPYGSGNAFDWDCEGYGNPRIVDYLGSGGVPDIGADEVGYLVIGGFDGIRWSKDFNMNAVTPNMHYWFHQVGSLNVTLGYTYWANLADPLLYVLYLAGKTPSMRPKGTSVPTQYGPPYVGLGYLDATAAYVTFPITAFPMVVLPPQAPGLHNQQGALHDYPSFGDRQLTNLQTFRL